MDKDERVGANPLPSRLPALSLATFALAGLFAACRVWLDGDPLLSHQPLLLAAWAFRFHRDLLPRDRGEGSRGAGSPAAGLALCAAFLLYVVSLSGGIARNLSLTMPLLLLASFVWLEGTSGAAPRLFPLLCLPLCLPMPQMVEAGFTTVFQSGTVSFSSLLLRPLDPSLALTGETLVYHGRNLTILGACGGVQSFLVLLPLFLIFGRKGAPARRCAFLALLPLLVVCVNGARVAMVLVATDRIRMTTALALFHAAGPLVFLAAFLLARRIERFLLPDLPGEAD